jgi:hypothetical protein
MGAYFRVSVCVSFTLGVGTVHAEPPVRVWLSGACLPPDVSLDEVRRILEAELAPSVVSISPEGGAAKSENEAVVELDDCTDEPPGAHATFVWHGVKSDRRVELVDTSPDARPRVLALALAEGIRNQTESPKPATDGERHEPLPSAPAAPVPHRRPAVEETPTKGSLRLRAAAHGRYVTRTNTLLAGPEIGVVSPRWSAGVVAFGTQRSSTLGDARLFVFAATGAADLITFGGTFALRTALELGAAVGAGTGYSAVSSFTVWAPHAAVALGFGGAIFVHEAWRIHAFAGGGYATSLTAQGNGNDLASAGGAFVDASLGVEFSL